MTGHTDTVNAVKFFPTVHGLYLITGSVDQSVRIWRQRTASGDPHFECVQILQGHTSSINCIASATGSSIFATGAADASVKIWKIKDNTTDGDAVELLQSVTIKPRFFPLALALAVLDEANDSYILAVAGTTTIAQLYVSEGTPIDFKLRATLSGHEGWIRSLAFTNETTESASDLLLASASQDKYIRLWRIHQGKELPAVAASGNDAALGAFLPGKSLSNKAHRFTAGGIDYSATFEALLLGHEDWIYSTKWHRTSESLQLLSASADNSITVWEPDSSSGVWVSMTRLGEISAQKGSTTATGSTGGLWTGLFSPAGKTIVCLGRTGSWRRWDQSASDGQWIPGIGISGHTSSITGLSWSGSGSYLLTTSSDQTTRLHAQWKQSSGVSTWHEMARPQIHGYDLNCISTLNPTTFVSGADEKLLRVFTLPLAVGQLLSNISDIPLPKAESGTILVESANMPVLGLSNKAITDTNGSEDIMESTPQEAVDTTSKPTLDLDHPPLEDHLSRSTLFPEIEKLYGHGYEISSLCTSHSGKFIATACKASSIDHAVIRLFETTRWTEIKPPLAAHASTIHRMRFSYDDQYLLSVGRDRQWALWSTDDDGAWKLKEADLKAHSRMILDCAWAPAVMEKGVEERVFATAGRDKSVKIWKVGTEKTSVVETIIEDAPVTAVDFEDSVRPNGNLFLAVGIESGSLSVYEISTTDWKVVKKIVVESRFVIRDPKSWFLVLTLQQSFAFEINHAASMAT